MKFRRRKRLRILLYSIAGLAAALFGTYLYLTNPSRVRMQAQTALHAAGFADARIGSASFSLIDGLRLFDVAVPLSPAAFAPPREPRLHIGSAALSCNVW